MQRLIDHVRPVQALACVTPSSSTPTRVNLARFHHVMVLIDVLNGTTVTGSAITLKQAQDASGTNEKALAFSRVWQNTDVAAGETLTQTNVSSNTFTTDTTNSKKLQYIIEVNAEELDANNSTPFNYFRVGTGDAANTTVNVEYILFPGRYPQQNGGLAVTA